MDSKGQRLRQLRLLHGMTQTQFAERLNTPQSHLSAVERGQKPAAALTERASFVFKTPTGFFDQPPHPYTSGSLNFRTRKLSARVMEAANTTFAELEREARAQLMGTTKRDISRRDLADRSEVLPGEVIEDIAQQVRAQLHIAPHGPVLNVTRAVERAGIPVVRLYNPFVDLSAIDGISSPEIASGRGVIAVSDQDDGARVRFTRAHELGHLVLHTLVRPGFERVREEEAHLFAGAFLMPAGDAKAKLSPSLTLEGFAQVKAEYAVSMSALVRRAKDLGIISAERYRSLMIQLSSRGWRLCEPVRVPVEVPRLLVGVGIGVAGADDGYSGEGRARVVQMFKH